MTDQKQSASTQLSASTLLPNDNVIHLTTARHTATRQKAFTKANIGKMLCPVGKSETYFWDASCRGFGLRALASGRRTWIFQYRNAHQRTRRIALGDVSAVSLEAARQSARHYAASVTNGADPSAERQAKRTASTVLSIIDVYLKNAKSRQRRRSYEETERHLRKHCAPLHYERVEAVRRQDIAKVLDQVSDVSGPVAANRVRAALSALWSWSMRAGLIDAESNPVSFTLRHPERARERTLSDDELRAIWVSTDDRGDYARIVRLCLLTGCRREEIGGLRWDEVLTDRLLIGSGRMKGKSGHEVPLLPAIAGELPQKQKAAADSIFGRNGTGFSGWSKSKGALDARLAKAGVTMPRWTLHDLRRTFSTRLHDAGVEPLIVEALLAHKQQGVAAVYNRARFWNAKCDAMQRWHRILTEIIQPPIS